MEYIKIHINKYIDCVVSDAKDCDSLATSGSTQSVNKENAKKMFRKMYPVLNYRDVHEHYD